MILSCIDLGTNTLLMLTVERSADGTIRVLNDEHGIARLGKGVDAERRIARDAFDRVADMLSRYNEISHSLGAERIVAVGTSALRDAGNSAEFVKEMEERTGIVIRIISGDEEARLTYRGSLYGLRIDTPFSAVIDIGGGSTEVSVGDGKAIMDGISLDIGAVRITEKFFPELPPSNEQLRAAQSFIRDAFLPSNRLPQHCTVVGVAGTVTTLGALHLGQSAFNAAELDGVILPADVVAGYAERFEHTTIEQITALPGVHRGRADLLTAGTNILHAFLQHHNLPELTVSTKGLRYGLAQ